MDITKTPLTELCSLLEDGRLTSRSIVETYLERIRANNASLNVVCLALEEEALQAAEASDQRRKAGQPLSKLDGIPFVIKDILCTRGIPTTCGSRYLKEFVPPYDATSVAKLRAAGMVMLGKTNLDEFAMGGSTETSIFGSTRNPWDVSRTVGGSSGGSAAAIAARFAPLSVGSDTGGSIRQPAAYCGVSGLKPTYGRVSRYGLVAFASSLDSVGVFAATARDLAMIFEVIAGQDDRDSTCIPLPPPRFDLAPQGGNASPFADRAVRIGIVREYLDHPGLDADIRDAILAAMEVYKQAGATLVELSLPNSHYGVPTYYIIAPSEASSNLSRYDGAHYGHRASTQRTDASSSASPLVDMYCRSRSEGFGAEVQRRIMLGTYTLSSGYYDAYYLKALKVRRLIRRDYDEAFAKVDVILGPTTPGPPFRLGEKVNDPVQMYLEDWYTVGANLAGIPAVSIPCGKSREGLPIGMQIQGGPLEEEKVLKVADWYQRLVSYQPEFPRDPTSSSST